MKAFTDRYDFEKDENGVEWIIDHKTGERRPSAEVIGDINKDDATAKACANSKHVKAPARPSNIDEIEETE